MKQGQWLGMLKARKKSSTPIWRPAITLSPDIRGLGPDALSFVKELGRRMENATVEPNFSTVPSLYICVYYRVDTAAVLGPFFTTLLNVMICLSCYILSHLILI